MTVPDRAFDARTLDHLVEVTGDPDFVLRLVGTYRGLLARRIDRIESYVTAGDVISALDAVRSLKGGSLMTGAVELAAIATAMEDDLRDGDLAPPRAQLHLLGPAALRISSVLDEFERGLRPGPRQPEQPQQAQQVQASSDSMR